MFAIPKSGLKVPDVDICCACITDLKCAAAIIATLAIVTSPILSWCIVRHSYVIRVSCTMTTKRTSNSDVINYNLYNVLSFGFGANAGVEPSCLRPRSSSNETRKSDDLSGLEITTTIGNAGRKRLGRSDKEKSQQKIFDSQPMIYRNSYEMFESNKKKPKQEGKRNKFVAVATYLGWFVVMADIAFIATSISFMMGLYRPSPTDHYVMTKIFLMTGITSVILSFIYGMLYVFTCIIVGGGFPLCEFVLILIDLSVWTYFLMIIKTYMKRLLKPTSSTHFAMSSSPKRKRILKKRKAAPINEEVRESVQLQQSTSGQHSQQSEQTLLTVSM